MSFSSPIAAKMSDTTSSASMATRADGVAPSPEKTPLGESMRRLDRLVPNFSPELKDAAACGIERRLPRNGDWDGIPGDSTWYPDRDDIPPQNNPAGRTWGEILDEHGLQGVPFDNLEPDFSEVSEGTVEIEEFSENRYQNFTQADEKLAQQWTEEQHGGKSWSPQDVREYRNDNNLTWHERSDMKTMDLVPADVHGNVPHSGGVYEAKRAAAE